MKPSFSILMPRGIVTPSKRRRSRSRFRRRSRKRTTRRAKMRSIFRSLPIGGFRPRHRVRLRYSDVISLDAGSGASGTAAYVFSANNIFDPDTTGTGHQPLYRDTWASAYKAYIVLGAKIRAIYEPARNVALINSSDIVTDAASYTIGCVLSDSSTDYPSATNTLVELGNSTRCTFKVIPAMATNKFTHVVKTYSPHKFYGVKDTTDHLADLGSTVGGGPTSGAYFILFIANADNSTNVIAVNVRVIVDYYVMFYDINDNIAAS